MGTEYYAACDDCGRLCDLHKYYIVHRPQVDGDWKAAVDLGRPLWSTRYYWTLRLLEFMRRHAAHRISIVSEHNARVEKGVFARDLDDPDRRINWLIGMFGRVEYVEEMPQGDTGGMWDPKESDLMDEIWCEYREPPEGTDDG